MKEELRQQGDVLMFKAEKMPEGLKPVKPEPRGFILAHGEATGHAHVIDAVGDCELYTNEINELWLWAKEQVIVKHDEHKPVTLDTGFWKVGRVQEVDPFAQEIRKVAD
jgi:hypothetical protein